MLLIRFTSTLVVMLAIVFSSPAYAEKLYKSQDANGRIVFSDRPMDGHGQVEIRQVIPFEKTDRFSIRNTGTKERPVLAAINGYYAPIQVGIGLTRNNNISTSSPLPATFIVPANKRKELVSIGPASERQGWSYTYQTRMVIGDPTARHAPFNPYVLPVPSGMNVHITQAFNGEFSHNHPQSEYAVDIAMPEGTPIHAARGGVVMDVANDFLYGGVGEKYEQRANFIRILHDDGTMAIYAHLQLESAQVPVGATVQAGDVIGASGNTGYSSGPHLHFAVQKNFGMELRSVPFEFGDEGGRAFTPARGMVAFR